MTTESLPEHIFRPHLRPIQPMPIQKDGRQFVALRDPAMLQSQTMVVPVQAMTILQQFHGKRSLEELATQFSSNPDQLAELAKGLDGLGLLWGPTFERLESDRWEELESSGAYPARASSTIGTDEDACRTAIEEYFEQTEDPELETPARAIVSPHLDYPRGWPNYAAAYYGLDRTDPPDRVVVLGTNHFGLGDGVVLSQLGFDTPMGRSPIDEAVSTALIEKLGRPLVVDQLDHLPEHSVELQIPWIQYCFGHVPVVAALVPDPLADPIEDDGGRITGPQFADALSDTLAELGGRTFFVASSDLSHVGPQFGEPRPVDEQRRIDVERHDRDMMSKFIAGDAEEFLSAMRWNKNPTRWCSVGSMNALLLLTCPETIELIDYRQAYDERGMALVSSAAMALS
jgi:AmmeMemoRadiSam system protein B